MRVGAASAPVAAIETGKSEPSLSTAFRLAGLFERPVEDLFTADLEEKMAFLNATWQYQDRMATAFDEVGVLDEMGREGWEMTGCGPLVLRFRRPEDATMRTSWAYERLTELGTPRKGSQLEQEGWTSCGSWMNAYHYFKRAERCVAWTPRGGAREYRRFDPASSGTAARGGHPMASVRYVGTNYTQHNPHALGHGGCRPRAESGEPMIRRSEGRRRGRWRRDRGDAVR